MGDHYRVKFGSGIVGIQTFHTAAEAWTAVDSGDAVGVVKVSEETRPLPRDYSVIRLHENGRGDGGNFKTRLMTYDECVGLIAEIVASNGVPRSDYAIAKVVTDAL